MEVHVGPMFAGKTTALLRRVKELRESGEEVIVVKAAIEDCYDNLDIVFHAGERLAADEVMEKLEQVHPPVGRWVAIEELHMFPDAADTCALW